MEGLHFLTKKDSVAEALRQEIVRGILRPGQQLEQDQVAARLNVSATPVREAFSVLEAEGLLEVRAHRGAVVAHADSREAEGLYELRYVLEMNAMRRTLRRPIDGRLVSDLERITKQVENARSGLDMHSLRAIQVRFHERLVESCGSQAWTDVTKRVISQSLFLVPLNPARQRRITREHRGIVAALKRGDKRLTEKRMDDHLRALVRAVSARKEVVPTSRSGTRGPTEPHR